MNRFRSLLSFIRYYFASTNQHGVHSPFVYTLVTKVIYNKQKRSDYKPIGEARKELLKNNSEISITDLGAGSKVSSSNKRRISDIARNAAKPAKYGELLFRLTGYFQPSTILELGTSLGLSALYLASAQPTAKMITIEGCPQTAAIAQQLFDKMKRGNIELMQGNFDDVLPSALKKLGKVDLVFFDGNHRKAPTLKYFEEALSFAHNDSVFIFDDIHWSDKMSEAWEAIKAHPQVTVTVDLHLVGIVFFRKEQREEHFVIRF